MALAGGCVTGMLWKAGSGSVALAMAIVGFAGGELLVRGPGTASPGLPQDAVWTQLSDAKHFEGAVTAARG